MKEISLSSGIDPSNDFIITELVKHPLKQELIIADLIELVIELIKGALIAISTIVE